MSNNFVFSNNFLWLYSANFSPKWWCYDPKTCEALENAYQSYNNSNNKKVIKVFNILKNLKNKNGNNDSINSIGNNTNVLPTIKIHHVMIKDTLYRIDFDKMKQINVHDMTKQRNIKRVNIDQTKNHDDLIKGLQLDHAIKGVSGVEFIKK